MSFPAPGFRRMELEVKYTTDCTAAAKNSGASGNAEEKYASAPCQVVTNEII